MAKRLKVTISRPVTQSMERVVDTYDKIDAISFAEELQNGLGSRAPTPVGARFLIVNKYDLGTLVAEYYDDGEKELDWSKESIQQRPDAQNLVN